MATMAEGQGSKDQIQLLGPQRAILHLLVYHGIKTEYELIEHVKKQLGISEDTATADIGKWLSSLRRFGLIWAGIVTNAENVGMWVAVATSNGKIYAKEKGI